MGHQFIYGTTLFFMVLLNSINTTAQSTVTLPAVCGCTGGTISTLDCGAAINNGTLNHGTPASGVYSIIPYTGGDGGTYNAQTVASTGVTGLTATLTAGGFPMGNSDLIYTISGTPTSSGTAMFPINIGGQSCVLSRTVAAQLIPSNPIGMGSFSGRLCFDIAESNDDINSCGSLTARATVRANFNQIATNTQTYTFTPTGTVSNVRFYYVNTNGQVIMSISGGNSGNNISTEQTVTVVYNTALSSPNPSSPTSALALGLPRSNPLTADIYVVYNDGATNNGTDLQLNITANIKDCSCCGAPTNSGGWLEFMCHNLGADYTADPFIPSWKLNGAYFQWGKKPVDTNGDGYRTKPNNGPEGFAAAPTGATVSTANAGTITNWSQATSSSATAWNSGTLLAPVKSSNDPCPAGYRVPTKNEWESIANAPVRQLGVTGNVTNDGTNYTSGLLINDGLYLPYSGKRYVDTGILSGRGSTATYYQTSTIVVSGVSWSIRIGNNDIQAYSGGSTHPQNGMPIRCVKN